MARIIAALGFLVGLLLIAPANAKTANGLEVVKSEYSVSETADRLVSALEDKGMTVFKRVDHAGGAGDVGIDMAPMELVIFGNPAIGSKLMKCDRSVGIDLPMKALIMQGDGGVRLAYNSVDYLAQRHDLADCQQTLDKVRGALKRFAAAATGA